ncbi:MAG: hypothetical protein HQM12_12215 [SAR324 cluster bacterium]|nr:hypothetical protein [SAR324 cluster bacterium]
MPKDVVETQFFKTWLEEDGIVYSEVVKGSDITLEVAIEQLEIIRKLSKSNKKVPLFVDSLHIGSMSRDARLYFTGEESFKTVSAVAILVGGPISKVIGNFFIGLNKSGYPNKLFDAKEDAVEWLKGFLNEQ